MKNWYLYIESDKDLSPIRWEVGFTSMPPNQHLGERSIMYIVAEKPLEKIMRTFGMKTKTSENLKGAIAAYYTGGV
jgi:hypothetical protein